MLFIIKLRRGCRLFALLALFCSNKTGILPADAAYYAASMAAIMVDTPHDSAKPPLSEQEIFPHLNMPGKTGGKAATPPDSTFKPPANDKTASAAQKRRDEEDKLFAELKRSADFAKAEAVSRSIEGLWAQSGSDSIDLLMFWANKEIAGKNYAIALDFLDNVVALAPDYAEGWLRRASVHLMTNDIALSMVEMQRVLQLEPRHYNAMLQLGAVMEMTGRPAQALQAYEKALEFYPQMRSAQRRIQVLIEKDSSRAI
ncbi:MAG: hypothetical protein DU429_08145 [Candidatus Tokpelaia sp.]|nr:MAG: hypothetical protein DU430_08425 [Candidatus Tokpelaia sp.]KAA6205407.1 MAG: hypothetical protein DU429_08145 [Candidatus Tokpelaia sp.]KAA6406156.1 hypothetical protein DPQ22_01635 [Candidatus Tokpelaia sp.]